MSKKKQFFDKITLNSGNSLIVGNSVPGKLDIDSLTEHPLIPTSVSRLGLFGMDSPSLPDFYKDIKPEDLVINDTDIAKPVFRALSEVIVNPKWNPTDFSEGGVLKASMAMLLGQTVYRNHEAIVGNELGSVSKVSWQESYTSSGIKVPSGINMELSIDGKTFPSIVRAISMTPPAIHSNSVTVSFKWEKSHSLEDTEFFSKLGTYGADGKLVRKVVSEILGYHETSLVPHGADPFAQQIRDGKIVNPEYANSVYSLSAQDKAKPPVFYISYKQDNTQSLSLSTPPEQIIKESINKNYMKRETLLLLMALHFGIKVESKPDMEESEFEALLSGELAKLNIRKTQDQLTNNQTEIDQLKKSISSKDEEISGFKTQLEELAGVKEFSEAYLKKTREETIKFYQLSLGDKADKVVEETINKCSPTELESFYTQYKTLLEKDMPLQCEDCNSTKVSRKTSKESQGTGEAVKKEKTSKVLTDKKLPGIGFSFSEE